MVTSNAKRCVATLLLLIAAGLVPGSASVAAQLASVTVYLQPMSMADGQPAFGACFILVGASIEGCDENGDGYIQFADVAPGSYTVHQTRDAPGFLPMGDVTILVRDDIAEQVFQLGLLQQSQNSSGGRGTLVDIAIVPTDSSTGDALPGACFIIADVSEEGCDENGDGKVTFADVPVGSYYVTETHAPDGYDIEPPQWLVIERGGQIRFLHRHPSSSVSSGSSSSSDGQLVHVSLVTRDPENGELVTGACYIIENASIEGCDENDDGQVDFADVTPGTYIVRQTETPSGYASVREFKIRITDDPMQAFIVKQSPQQHDADHRNLSIVLIDKRTGERITGDDACVRIIGVSEIGCDENGDGQIDFLDIPVGRHTVKITEMPRGYHGEYSRYTLNVKDSRYSIVTVYLELIRD